MIRGLVIGKFYPPHNGHRFLIETALRVVDHLDVIVCAKEEQTISGERRAAWLKEIHPSAHVHVVDDFGDDDNSEAWAAFTKKALGYAPDKVFTSEEYGTAFAYFLGCEHVLVDRNRNAVPISATSIRANPFDHWDFLQPCVRAYYAKRICVVGAESTGTTTLAMELAARYKTVCVPEFGREYCQRLVEAGADLWNYKWQSNEFVYIAEQQARLEDELARDANRILICDTDPFATTIWHQRYMGFRSPEVETIANARSYALYILTDCDIPFVQDGLRDGESIRKWMTGRFEEELAARGVPWIKVSGTRERRLKCAMDRLRS